MSQNKLPKVIIIGAGFAGLFAARKLTKEPVDILLIDRNNYHTFTPLLYQVATCGLDPSHIAYPTRSIFRNIRNIRFLLGEVTNIDYQNKAVIIKSQNEIRQETYDYLIVAAGTVTNFFGNTEIETYSFGLKDLKDCVRLRNHILKLFEKAAWTKDSKEQQALTTILVAGGGPTGLETAGALYELYNFVLSKEYERHNGLRARVVLVEALDRLLIPYPERLQNAALKQLEGLGVEVILNKAVKHVDNDRVVLSDGETIYTHTLIWAAGVKASPIAEFLDVKLERGGRIPVKPTLEVVDREHVYAAGDIAYLTDDKGQPYPQVITVAQQQGRLIAENILRRLKGNEEKSFTYSDKGIMATIGRRRAVAYPYNKIQLTGYPAWLTWLSLHLIWLMGFRNRLNVFVNWIWNYLTYDRSVRIILEPYAKESTKDVSQPSVEQDA